MDQRVGLLIIVLLSVSWLCEARQLGDQIDVLERSEQEIESVILQGNGSETASVCSLCKSIATKALAFLQKDGTQTSVTKILKTSCSILKPIKTKCNTFVNTYVPLFFVEVKLIQASTVCKSVKLCQAVAALSFLFKEDSCELCHRTVSEIIIKLKDPDTRLEILELLLKACNSLENYQKQCKRMVFEYAPIILANVEKFLKTTDVCTVFHACKPPPHAGKQASETVAVLADS